MTTLHVYVTPKSGRNEISGWRGGELLLKVTAPPEDGKANAAVCKLLAKALGVPKSAVCVTRGETSRHKTVEIVGVDEAVVRTAFIQDG
jgi:uncharacterized protein (TIGR00251 family)